MLLSNLKDLYWKIRGYGALERGGLTADLLKSVITRENPVILEVGCNDGAHTQWFQTIFPGCLIHCFEPDDRAIGRFREKIGNHPRVTLHNVAVGRTTGRVKFYPSCGDANDETKRLMPKGWDLSGSIKRPTGHLTEHPYVGFSNPVEVPCISLDDWLQSSSIQVVDLLWMDVQGAEADVIAGASRTLEKVSFIYAEYSNRELYEGQLDLPGLRAALPQYRVVKRFPQDVLMERKHKN